MAHGGRTRPVLVETLPSAARIRQDDLALRRHTHLSDEALVALVARGDESALAELYDRVGRVAYGIAFRVLRDDRLAEDAVQEGFLAAWRSAATFRADRAKASTWIVTLVHRRAVDIVRRETRRRAEPLETETRPDPVDPIGSAADAAWLGFERDRVQAALRALPDAQREAIELAYYGGYSQSELAERLGLPLGTIKSRMFAGLARLRELLDDAESEGSWTPRLTS
jgi:RNA polymerase sigma-70 factor (ECF subfamily)